MPLEEIARAVGTPCYVYSASGMRARYHEFRDAFAALDPLVCYAVKANDRLAVIRTFARAGAGADTVSGGEIVRALRAGVPPERIVFAGVAKTDEEIALALHTDVRQLNVESVEELRRVSAIAVEVGRTARIALRVNPDIAAPTLEKISTGRKQDKFGIAHDEAPAVLALARDLEALEPVGLHMHIGSQIGSAEPFEQAYAKILELFRAMRADGHALRALDLGGGFALPYAAGTATVPLERLAATLQREMRSLDCELVFEPGRSLVGGEGALVASVVYQKHGSDRSFMLIDAGMHTLVRPAMYGARHEILALREEREAVDRSRVDVVGPICESSDVFGRDYELPRMRAGDRLAIMHAGAYGAVMASHYNSRPAAAEVLVDGPRWSVIRERRDLEDQLSQEAIPDWMTERLCDDHADRYVERSDTQLKEAGA